MSERLLSVSQVWSDDAGKTRTVKVEYGEDGNAVLPDVAVIAPGDLPADFPSREIFRHAGYGTVAALKGFAGAVHANHRDRLQDRAGGGESVVADQ